MATKPIERCMEDDYIDYDGEEEINEPDDDWLLFNDSFNW